MDKALSQIKKRYPLQSGFYYCLLNNARLLCHFLYNKLADRGTSKNVDHTNKGDPKISNGWCVCVGMRSRVRGYVLTKCWFSFSLFWIRNKADSLFNELQGLVIDNPVQTKRLIRLKQTFTSPVSIYWKLPSHYLKQITRAFLIHAIRQQRMQENNAGGEKHYRPDAGGRK